MKRKYGRILAFLLALSMVAALVPVRADASAGYARISGENRFETAFRVADTMKETLGVEKFQAVIVASGTNFADALSGSYLANVKSAPILLSYNDTYNEKAKDYIRANLAENGTVYILGGTAAVPESMESGLEDYNVVRLAGENRFETNLLILKEAGVSNGQEVLVCTGTNFADSLSASAVGMPILLVWNGYDGLNDSQIEYVKSLFDVSYCIIGGESAVSERIKVFIDFHGRTNADRLAGANRFETSVLVAERYFDIPEAAVLAYAWNYPDGLCGGPLAYAMGCPLILTMNCLEDQAYTYAKYRRIDEGFVLGGEKLISDRSAAAIFGSGGVPGHEYQVSERSSVCVKCGDTFCVKPGETSVKAGTQFTLKASYSGSGELTWSSGDATVASVEGSGKEAVVTARRAGTAVITVTDGAISASAVITVTSVPDEEAVLTLNVESRDMAIGDTYQIPYIYSGSGTLTWSSGSEAVATVDQNGVVTAVGVGCINIKVTDGTWVRRCEILVKAEPITYASVINVVATDGPFYDGVARYAGDFVNVVFRVDVDADNKDITVTSSNINIVSISKTFTGIDNGRGFDLNFHAPGTATITVRSDDGAVTQTYEVTVKPGYTCAHGGGTHTPEEWAECATSIACANGMTRSDTLGSWRLLTLSADELTFDQAILAGQGIVHDYWPNGKRYCAYVYVGQDEDGNYQFHKCWG